MGDFPPQGSGISNVIQLIQTITVSVDTTSITFSNLDINTDKKYMIDALINCKQNNTSYSLFVNNNTTAANYYRTELNADFGAVATTSGNDAGFIFISQAGDRLYADIKIILGDDGLTRSQTQIQRDLFGIGNQGVWLASIAYSVAIANITRLDIVGNNADSIGAGSFFRLYRIKP
jgi:hypothetical protein